MARSASSLRKQRVREAAQVLQALGLPKPQQGERSALTLLALCELRPGDPWPDAARPLLRTVEIMSFMRKEYRKNYAPNTRETIRRQTLHPFIAASVADLNPDEPERPTNSGYNRYALSGEALAVIRRFGKPGFDAAAKAFVKKQELIGAAARASRAAIMVAVPVDAGTTLHLSPGKHSQLQRAVLEHFLPRFAPGARVLYVGDTAKKHSLLDAPSLSDLGITLSEHAKLPDIVLFRPDKGWLYLVEAVTSHGPISQLRLMQLRNLLRGARAPIVYITAFATRADFRRFAADIAWETEAWIAEAPDHLVHFNGHKFLGPFQESIQEH